MLLLLNANERLTATNPLERLEDQMPRIRQVLNLADYNEKGIPEREHPENRNLAIRKSEPI